MGMSRSDVRRSRRKAKALVYIVALTKKELRFNNNNNNNKKPPFFLHFQIFIFIYYLESAYCEKKKRCFRGG
jgi:hypothetical protein